MMAQARPEDDQEPEAAPNPTPGGGERRPLRLPQAAPPEERKPYSTRVKPSLKRELEAYVQEIRDAGFAVTQEMVLDALLRELRDSDELRERLAEALIREFRG